MNGTNYATAGRRSFTGWDALLRFRLLIFFVFLAVTALLLTSIKTSLWGKVGKLHQKFSNVQSNAFYPVVGLWADIRELNDALLRNSLEHKGDLREVFRSKAAKVEQDLVELKTNLSTNEYAAFEKLDAAYHGYQSDREQEMTMGLLPAKESFESMHDKREAQIQPVLATVGDLVKAQNHAFDLTVEESETGLSHLQRLLTWSLVLLWISGAFLVALGYRGMIVPMVTRLNQSRVIIERQEKLASLGLLASGVAHEIRNPLTAIKFRLFSLNQAMPQVADQEDAKVISAEIDRLDRIVKDFLQFARPSDPKLVALPAEKILRKVYELLQPDLQKEAIELKIESAGTTWIQADLQQLEQVLINLIQNAAESIGHQGTITLRVRESNAGSGGQVKPAVILEVSDTGKGIPPEVEKRLFDPFFTTKESGTGLGLAIAARIIEKHGGVLRHNTRLNHGTTFEIVLPKLEANAS
jgi:signal transduction histidine kinase